VTRVPAPAAPSRPGDWGQARRLMGSSTPTLLWLAEPGRPSASWWSAPARPWSATRRVPRAAGRCVAGAGRAGWPL